MAYSFSIYSSHTTAPCTPLHVSSMDVLLMTVAVRFIGAGNLISAILSKSRKLTVPAQVYGAI